jgi:hypothetical protein
MTSKTPTLSSLRSTKEGLLDPYDVLDLWRSTTARGNKVEIDALEAEIKEAGLLTHPLLQLSLTIVKPIKK